MKKFLSIIAVILSLVLTAALTVRAFCDETRSYNKQWTLQAREREATRAEREAHYKTLTKEQLMSISDIEMYPTHQMTCGMGFSEGLAKVIVDGKAGFIDTNGKLAVKPAYNDAGKFSGGLAPVENDKGKWGYINTRGEMVIQPVFDWALLFCEGLALVQVGEKWGYIDQTGKFAVEPQFDHANSFSEGVANVELYLLGDLPGYKEPTERYKTGFIDKKGKWVIQPAWDGGEDFSGGLALVSRNVGYNNGVVSESVIIDKTGKQLWEVYSTYARVFTDDVLIVGVEDSDDYSFVDRSGKLMTDEEFGDLGGFTDGMAPAKYSRYEGKYGYIDKTGKFVIRPKFEIAWGFSDGLARVCDSRTRCGYIDKAGKYVIKVKFDWSGSFENGFALVAMSDKAGYIDKTGNYIWRPTR